MDQVLSLRPFVPARDFALSKRFYQALGFRLSHEGREIALLKTGGVSCILQDFYNQELAENLMVQLMVRTPTPGGAAWTPRRWCRSSA